MPEFYAEPMKDRQSCSVCKKTVTGKKVLLTCINCHSITYCGVECQKVDWERHEWNCVPVMVTELPGKGRGLVAAKDIKNGELIFKDRPVIKFALNDKGLPVDPEYMTSLREQIDSLPAEARSQFYKLTTRNDAVSRSDNGVFNLFLDNCQIYKFVPKPKGEDTYSLLYLNIALVNHSCVSNAVAFSLKQVGDEDLAVELRAIKNIGKGEEVTHCYFTDVKKFGSIQKKRKTLFKKKLEFDCKCPACLGQVPSQEKTLKKLIDVHNKLNPTRSDWKREAGLLSRVVDLTLELKIGHPLEKISALDNLVGFAHLARDKDLVKKAMDMLKQFAEDYNLDAIQGCFDAWEMELAKWSSEFSLKKAPLKKEIDLILSAIQVDDLQKFCI